MSLSTVTALENARKAERAALVALAAAERREAEAKARATVLAAALEEACDTLDDLTENEYASVDTTRLRAYLTAATED